MQLLHQYSPQAAAMMVVLTAVCEPLGIGNPQPDSLLGFDWSLGACVAIIASAVLALLVTLSTLLTIGATSAVTFNILGHLKTFIITLGGVMLFDEAMPAQKAYGIAVAMVGIAGYSYLQLSASTHASSDSAPMAMPLLDPARLAGSCKHVDADEEKPISAGQLIQ